MSTAANGKPVVLIAEELSPATVDALGPDFEIRQCNGADRAELLPAIADVDAILVRSATKVDAEAIAAAKKLKVVARAGVGLDNVDVSAATKAGVMVVNAPTSNIVTAAELACGLLLATARNIPQANAALKNGEWKRSKYTGVELAEKTLGVVGLGRIGALVAQRMSAFGMKVVAYDPYVQPARAAQMGVKVLSLDELLEVSDFITVHLPKTPETLGLIGDEALHKVKPTVRIVNAARGGIVDEEARTPPSRRAASPAPVSTCTRRSPARTPRSSSSTRSSAPRTSAPPRTRRRRRPVSPSPSRCVSRSPVSWCRTP
ncbi:Glyoxylate/hydroxypyruvate reductase B [Streptomyces alboniger]